MAKRNANSTSQTAGAPAAAPGLVTVYCALPNGLSFTLPDGRELTFNGANTPRGMVRVLTAGRYGMTPGIAADDWEWIRKHYGEAAYFTAVPPLLFAEADPRNGDAQAREVLDDVTTGMEQVDVNGSGAGGAGAGTQTEPEGR